MFIYHIPVELPDGSIIKKVDLAHVYLPPDITRDDAVEAIGNNISMEKE